MDAGESVGRDVWRGKGHWEEETEEMALWEMEERRRKGEGNMKGPEKVEGD